MEISQPPLHTVPFRRTMATRSVAAGARTGGRAARLRAVGVEGKTPYDEFVSFYGERGREFLGMLNIRRINADFVTLDPSLLGPEFKREADNAMLRRKGVEE